MMNSGLPPSTTFSSSGRMSATAEILPWCSSTCASSRTTSWRSASVTKCGEMKPLSNCMPSVKSSSIAVVEDSSTVMTPSLPTLSKASASRSPISRSWLETEATDAIWALPSTGVEISPSFSESASTAFSMPRLRAAGAAPEATLRRPSCTMAWARTVAVVVPSPATSLVLVATSFVS